MKTQYIIYKVSGGLCHMLSQINSAIHLSKITQRFLIIDCFAGAFSNDFNKYFNVPDLSYSTSYKCLYENESLKKDSYESFIKSQAKYDNGVYFLNEKMITINFEDAVLSKDDIIYCSWIRNTKEIPWYVKVNKNIIDQISVNKINYEYVGFHYRNTDMKHQLESFIPKIIELSSKCNVIYLGTDDYTALNRLNSLLNNKFKIIQYTKPFNNSGDNIHYGNPDKDEVIMNALVDIYHLTRATYFIPSSNNSAFSIRISEIRKNDNFFN